MADKKVIIVESPTKARTIRRFLGSDCTVVASNGHIRTLPKNDLCIDVKNGYKPKYIIDETKEKVISQIKSELKGADELILATDEDREGESISWHLVEVLKPKMPTRRMVFHEITKKAILEAFAGGRDLDMNLVHAQEARRILDRLFGYTISPVLWSKLSNKSLSAGRVQSPGLRLVVDRERTRITFQKSEYWDLRASFREGFFASIDTVNGLRVANGKDFDSETGKYMGSSKVLLLSKEAAKALVDSLKDSDFTISDVKEKQVTQRPAPPFITSTLQQEGNRKLHMSAKDTMRIAQSLYENGFITYMRTDSPTLSQEGIRAAREAALALYGKDFVPAESRQYAAKSSNAQEAHEAIRPAGEHFRTPEETGLSGRELELYTLIWKRTLASQMTNALKLNTTVTIDAKTSDGKDAQFTATGIRIEFPGFIRVYVEGSDDPDAALEDKETPLPALKAGQVLGLKELEELLHETKEPNRYTEASLVQTLEKLGIGRPSTYAAIIDRLFEKNYVIRDNGTLVPTFIGFGIIQLLEKYFADRIDYGFTSDMETGLDEIAEGKLDELQFLKNFYEGEKGLDQQVRGNKMKINSRDVKCLELPQLSEENSIFLGPYGPYVRSVDGRFVSIPNDWIPADVTNEMVEKLRTEGNQVSEAKSNAPEKIGSSSDGQPILYCTGKFGDYWQLGDRAQTEDIKRFKVPKEFVGNRSLDPQIVEKFFNLPRTVGTNEAGEAITADMGKYGPYIKCGNDFRSVKSSVELFNITESEAREIFNAPKDSGKKTASKGRAASSTKRSSSAEAVVDFGEYEGKSLGIYHGRYGYYLRHGESNVRISKEYQQDEEACKAMSRETAISFLK
ncbi:MAG: type I DNA topoisomerase [Spirochaetales bacterium]|nr:type I DNA topoisomerase [Spirochaetales bacterium]